MRDDALTLLTLTEQTSLLQTGEVSAVELTQAYLNRIERLNPKWLAYARIDAEQAHEEALAVDARRQRGEALGPLAGVPLAVKDLCWVAGRETAAGTRVYRGFMPPVDATVVARLRAAGAVLLGSVQMTEAAFSAHHPEVTPPRNPWHPEAWTGVSSSGSGVAVAASLCAGALGSDTGGSIRFPAAACGITGLKPTWGRVSRYGVFELAGSLDHIGPMARSAADCATLLAVIAGADPQDPTTLPESAPVPSSGEPARLDGLRVGLDEAWACADVDSEVATAVRSAARVLTELGAQVVPVQVPPTDPGVEAWVNLCAVEAAAAHAETFPAQRQAYGPMLASLLDQGHSLSALALQRALAVRQIVVGRMAHLMQTVDLLLMPAMPLAGPSLSAIAALRSQAGHRLRLSRYTVVFDLTGQPALSLPGGFTAAGLPVGIQLAGRMREDALLLRAGRAFQTATDWHRRHPPGL